MRRGGFLDGFPLHLLTRNHEDAGVLVIDQPDLGILQLGPESVPTPILAVSRDLDCLRLTARQQRNAFLVCADPCRLPLRDRSLAGIVVSQRFEDPSGQCSRGIPEELGRTLRLDGWLAAVGWTEAPEAPFAESDWNSLRYSVHPSSGREYFLVPHESSSTWLLKQLQIGRVQAVRAALKRILRWCGARGGTVSAAVYSRGEPSNLIGRWAGSEKPAAGAGSKEGFGLFVKTGWNAVLLNRDPDRSVVKFPLSPEVRSEMQKHVRNLDALRSASIPELTDLIPRVVESGSIDSQDYHAESRCAGTVSTKFWWKPRLRRRAVESAIDFLAGLHRTVRRSGPLDRTTFDNLLGDSLQAVERGAARFGHDFKLDQLTGKLWSLLGGRDIPLVRSHGDFWGGNLLVSDDGALKGVLDWGRSADRDWPVVDLIHLIACQRKWRAIWRFGALVRRTLLPGKLSRWERAAIRGYFEQLGLDAALWPGFVGIYWLRRISQLLDQNVSFCDDSWLQRNCFRTLPDLVARLGSGT